MHRKYGMSMELGEELVYLNKTVEQQEMYIDELRIKVAMYKAAFFHKYDLYEKLVRQRDENRDARIGGFDGFCYCSWREHAVFRSLEDMYKDGLLTENEYSECEIL